MDLESSKSKQFVASKGSLQEEKMVRALVVDDDSIVRKIHMRLLRKLGLKTEAVENGKEAVDLCQSGKSFDLVLMDMEMPIMDGPTATKELRAMGVTNMIVGVTSCSMESETQAFIRAGVDGCIKKPLSIDAVNNMMNDLVKKL
ncbi:two-component response regulator 24-like [Primulina huaijiensis]|uniref:two-component response regulator 24-like n=1 Tax=Primulina huaijiensis TaxID=1492673 RepID=UPI003CC75CAE